MPILSRHIRDGEVTSADIQNQGVATADIADNAITAAKLATDAVETAKIKDANVTPAKTNIAEARTATADGTGTGTISATSTFVTVTCDNADKIIVLPAPTPGREVWLQNAGTGYELRSSAPATVGINGGTGSNVESAIGANITVHCKCVSATAWICSTYTAAGVKGVVEVAA